MPFGLLTDLDATYFDAFDRPSMTSQLPFGLLTDLDALKLGFNFGLGGVSIAFRLTDGFGHAIDKITIAYANAIVSIAFRLTDGFGPVDTLRKSLQRQKLSQLPFGLLTDLDHCQKGGAFTLAIIASLNCLSAY